MGFFSDLWNGIKSVAGQVYNAVRKPIDFVSKGLEYTSKIPVLGGLLAPVKGLVGGAKSILDQGQAVGDVVKAIGLREGGMVPMKKFYQA
jgi:hypothetical protein